ncbi:MAG: molybdenum cofactor guanylyltransferase [Caulobacteraceae bacterium]
MRTLGVVLAGGASRRFGSDKARAMLGGRSLLEHAVRALRPHCDEVAIVGRRSRALLALDDRPGPGLGPLGGLAGALDHAARHGFGQVLSIPVDCARLPPNVRDLLEPAPSFVHDQPVIGLWPVSAAIVIDEMLGGGGGRAMRAFAERIGARAVTGAFASVNINTPADLDRLRSTLDQII